MFAAGLAGERCHIHCRSVPPTDDSAATSRQCPSSGDLSVSVVMGNFLVFLQLAVVQESLSTQVTHEGLGSTMEKHVGFQLVVLNETYSANFAFEWFLTRVNTNVSLQIVLKGKTCSTRITCEHFPSVD